MSDQLFYLFSAMLLGLVIGALLMYYAAGSNKNRKKSVAEIEKKMNKYQKDVEQHFEKTADLVDDLTQSYKKVFDHLGTSAKELLTEDQLKEQIEKRKDNKITLAFLSEDDEKPVEIITAETEIEHENIDLTKIDVENNQDVVESTDLDDETIDENVESHQVYK